MVINATVVDIREASGLGIGLDPSGLCSSRLGLVAYGLDSISLTRLL